jgi:hypothetical protein
MAQPKIDKDAALAELNQRLSEMQTQMSATLDGYALAKAQLKQLTMLAKQLQEQNAELIEYKDSNEDYKVMLEKKTSPAPKKKRAVQKGK